MSTFDVKVRKIDGIENHPNADRLELVRIGGYRAVVQKGIHKPEDLIVYVPEDSVFSDLSVAEHLKVDSYLTGKAKNRVKSIRLRGILSQGIVLPLKVVVDYAELVSYGALGSYGDLSCLQEGYNWADFLKIEKYEEPIPLQMRGKVRKWPAFLPHYDVENVKKPEYLNMILPGEPVVMTEKLHGTNMAVAFGPGLEEGEEAFVCSRNMALQEDDGLNVYWRAVRKYDLIKKLSNMCFQLNHTEPYAGPGVETLSLHGEVVGVQDLKYGLVNGEINFYAFDIMVNGLFLDYDEFIYLCDKFGIPRVPLLYSGPYDYEKLKALAEGKTTLPGGHLREGGVVHPIHERMSSDLGGERVQVKFISEAYLLRKGPASELH